MHGRDGVGVRAHPLLEQLVEPPVGQLPARPGQPVELEAQLLGRQQALPPVLGVRVGGDQRERGEVVAGDPGGGLGVQHVGAVAQPQRGPPSIVDPTRTRSAACRSSGSPPPIGSSTVSNDGPASAQLAPEVVHGELRVPEQLRLARARLPASTSATCRGSVVSRQGSARRPGRRRSR